jgi:RNA polymerase sigma factor (sigma-70 family)
MDVVEPAPDYIPEDRKVQVAGIVRDAGRRLFHFIRARVASEADAEDVLQDVWRQLITSLEDGPVEKVGAWLYTVARNRIIDRARKRQTTSLEALAEEAALDAEGLPGIDLLQVDENTPESEVRRRQFWERVHAALAELPAEQRQTFVWHEFDGLTFQEIAHRTGEKVSTLLSRKRYALLHLRRRLKPWREEFLP